MRIVSLLVAALMVALLAREVQAFPGLFAPRAPRTIINFNSAPAPVIVPVQAPAPVFIPVQAPTPQFVPVQPSYGTCGTAAAALPSYGVGATYGVQANIFAARGINRGVVHHHHGTHAPTQANVRFRTIIR